MSDAIRHWSSKVEFIVDEELIGLQNKINEFCKDRFTVGGPILERTTAGNWICALWYKVQDD